MNKQILFILIAINFLFFSCKQEGGGAESAENTDNTVKTEQQQPSQSETSGPTADPGKPPYAIADSSKIIKTESGLKYYVVQEGQGNIPKVGQTIIANYHGMLTNGKVFDSSFDRGSPFQTKIGVGQVIKGWDEAFTKLKVGSKAVLIIPSDLGYGPQGSPPSIPGGSTLVFHVELLGAND